MREPRAAEPVVCGRPAAATVAPWLCALALACGCGDGSAMPPDARPDGAATDVGPVPLPDGGWLAPIEPPAEPAPPELPTLTPCPDGWREVPATDTMPVARCEPELGDGDACAIHQARLFGDETCRTIGRSCPEGTWPSDLPADGVIYVHPEGSSAPDGSREAPFGTLSNALDAASSGDTVVLAAGGYAAGASVPEGIMLRGSCVAETRIQCDTRGQIGLVVDTAGVTVRDLRIDGCGHGIVTSKDVPADYRLEGLLVTGSVKGWTMLGGRAEIDDVVFRDGVAQPGVTLAYGIGTNFGAELHGRRLLVERQPLYGALVSATTVELTDSVIRDVRASEDHDRRPRMFDANFGTQAVLQRMLLEDGVGYGVRASTEETRVELEDVLVRGVTAAPGASTSRGGMGIHAKDAATVVGRRARVRRTETLAVAAVDVGTRVELADAVLHETLAAGEDTLGAGVGMALGASLDLRRVVVADHRVRAIEVASGLPGGESVYTEAFIEDATILDVAPRASDGLGGCGLCAVGDVGVEVRRMHLERIDGAGMSVDGRDGDPSFAASDVRIEDLRLAHGGFLSDSGEITLVEDRAGDGVDVWSASAELERVVIRDHPLLGIVGLGEGADLRVTDVTVEHGRISRSDGLGGIGLSLYDGARASVTRALFADNRMISIRAAESSSARLDSIRVRDTRTSSEGEFGHGIEVVADSVVTATDLSVEGSHDVAVMVTGAGSDFEATRVGIAETREASCEGDRCVPGGVGVGAYRDGHASLESFVVVGHALCGLQVAGGTMDARDGLVARNPIGVNVTTEAFDIERLTEGVFYVDNDRKLDSSKLPVPEPGPRVEEEGAGGG